MREEERESNIVSRRTMGDNTECLSKPESSNVVRLEEHMKAMNDKMDFMMNVIKGGVATNPNDLIHLTDSPFKV